MGWYGGGMGWVVMFANLVFAGSLIAAVAWAVVRLTPHGGAPRRVDSSDARDILDRRFAAGEINAQQYQDALQVLATGRAR